MKIESVAGLLAVCVSVGCGGDAPETTPPPIDAGPDVGSGGGGSLEDVQIAAGGQIADAQVPDAPDAAPADAGDSDAPDAEDPEVLLPEGSRELDGVLNLVDADAAGELEEFILDDRLIHVARRQGLTTATNLFLSHYLEEYDFLYFFTDEPVAGARVAGKFEAVNRPAAPGGGNEIEIRAAGYASTGRLKGVVGFPYREGVYPPLAHETVHYWANHLDSRFRFGEALDMHYGLHWGFSAVNGVLGGFDGSTLRCQTPADAMPPACTALGSGRTRYVVDAFGPNDNTFRALPYSPFELYLMGLVPRGEVPNRFRQLEQAEFVEDSVDPDSDTVVVEAAGAVDVTLAQIVTRHGEIEPLAAAEREFKAAFVVLSSEPAPGSVMEEVAEWAAAFGGRANDTGFPSFETTASGHATLDTRLGPRRRESQTAPEPRMPLVCDLFEQDCPRPELACYQASPPLCALSGGVELDEPCDAEFACAAGLGCVAGSAAPSAFVCQPYCEPGGSSEHACSACSASFLEFRNEDGEAVGGLCLPE